MNLDVWRFRRAPALRWRESRRLRILALEPLEQRRLLSVTLPGLELADPSVGRFDGQMRTDVRGAYQRRCVRGVQP